MRPSFSGFKKFFEEMDQSQEKDIVASGDSKKQDYFASLEDEENMTWSDIKNTFSGEPWVSSHFPLGTKGKEVLYKLQPWKISKGSMTQAGADIELVHGDKDRSYLKGNVANKSKYKDRRKYFVKRKDLQDFLTGGWQPAIQSAAGGSPQM
jgi:hypothetical protein